MLAIRLPKSIEERLEKLARRIGRTKTFHVREAILQHLEDLADTYAAERDLRKLDVPHARRILKFLHERVAKLEDPRSIGAALQGSRLGEFGGTG
jgi:RHH-type transcriptional regulator, rel operon repressor / antitoxin RelB